MSYKAEVIADNSGEWVGNNLCFASEQEARSYAIDLASRWTAVRQHRVVRTYEPVTYYWTCDGRAQRIEAPVNGANHVLFKGYRKSIIAMSQAIDTLTEIEVRESDYGNEAGYQHALALRQSQYRRLHEVKKELEAFAQSIRGDST